MSDPGAGSPLEAAIAIAVALVLFGLAACLFRIWRGPTTADRLVALDLLAYQVIGMSAIVALEAGSVDLLGPALVLGLLAFLATVALARHIERGTLR